MWRVWATTASQNATSSSQPTSKIVSKHTGTCWLRQIVTNNNKKKCWLWLWGCVCVSCSFLGGNQSVQTQRWHLWSSERRPQEPLLPSLISNSTAASKSSSVVRETVHALAWLPQQPYVLNQQSKLTLRCSAQELINKCNPTQLLVLPFLDFTASFWLMFFSILLLGPSVEAPGRRWWKKNLWSIILMSRTNNEVRRGNVRICSETSSKRLPK